MSDDGPLPVKPRLAISTDAHGVEVLAKLMERYHLQRVADREVA